MGFIREYSYIDLHCAGEPFRLITNPAAEVPGATMEAKRTYAAGHLTALRRFVVLEPRGHENIYAGLLLPPVNPGSGAGVLFMTAEGMTTMCGHGTLCLARAAVELGLIPHTDGRHTFCIDAPSATVTAHAVIYNGEVVSTDFVNDLSFVCALDVPVEVPEIGSVKMDVGYGGAFMVFVRALDLGLSLERSRFGELMGAASACRRAAEASISAAHPDDPARTLKKNGCCLILVEGPRAGDSGPETRCFTVFGEGLFDRSPTGTGTSALAALLYERGLMSAGDTLTNRGVSGVPFTASIAPVEGGVIPTISGMAYVTARGTLLLEEGDPFPEGLKIPINQEARHGYI